MTTVIVVGKCLKTSYYYKFIDVKFQFPTTALYVNYLSIYSFLYLFILGPVIPCKFHQSHYGKRHQHTFVLQDFTVVQSPNWK